MGDTNILNSINNLISKAIGKQKETPAKNNETKATETQKTQKTQETTPKNPVDMAQDLKNKKPVKTKDENDKVISLLDYDKDMKKGISLNEFNNFIKDTYGEGQFKKEEVELLFNALDSSESKSESPWKIPNLLPNSSFMPDILTAKAKPGDGNLSGAELSYTMTAAVLEENLNKINKDEIETLNDGFKPLGGENNTITETLDDGTTITKTSYIKENEDGSIATRVIEKQGNGVTIVEDTVANNEEIISKTGHRTDTKGRLQSDWVYGKDKDGNETKLGTWYEYDEEGKQSVNTCYEYTFHKDKDNKITSAELRKWNSDGDDALNNKPEDKDLNCLFKIEYADDGKTEKSRTRTQKTEDGNTIVGQYDNVGQRISETERDKNENILRFTEFQANLANDEVKKYEINKEYDDNNLLVKTTANTFDENGDITKTIETNNEYDNNNLLIRTIENTFDKKGDLTQTEETRNFYDNDGKLRSSQVLNNCKYDEKGNLTNGEIIFHDKAPCETSSKTLTNCEYDEKGNIKNGEIIFKDGQGNITKSEVYTNGNKISYEYTDCIYDENGNMTSGTVTKKDKDENVTDTKEYVDFKYDKDGKVKSGTIKHTDKNKNITTETLTDCVLQNGGVVNGTKVIEKADGTIETRVYENCSRDKNGNITDGTAHYGQDGKIETRVYKNCVRDENNGVINGTIEFNKNGNKETRVYENCSRDENGKVKKGKIKYYDENGEFTDSTEYVKCSYDKNGNITSGTLKFAYSDGNANSKNYIGCEYDENGNITKGIIAYYNKEEQLAKLENYKDGKLTVQ